VTGTSRSTSSFSLNRSSSIQPHYTILVVFDPLFYHTPESSSNDSTWFEADLPEEDVDELLRNPDLNGIIEDHSNGAPDSTGKKRVYLCEAVSLHLLIYHGSLTTRLLVILDNENAKTPSHDDPISFVGVISRTGSHRHTGHGWL
jgi:hypothetical protein